MVKRTPPGLRVTGARFWREVTAAYDMNEAEERLLVEASRCLDELERLQAAVADAPLLVEGSTGQLRPHPLLEEVRKHRAVLQRLTGALAMPSTGEEKGRPAVSVAARRAAEARWYGERREA
jgi:hypothetical protein